MAIHPKLSPSPATPQQQQQSQQQQQQQREGSLTPQQATEISAWTEQASQALRDLDISTAGAHAEQSPTPPARDSSSDLVIPLDVDHRHHHHQRRRVDQSPTRLRAKNVRTDGAERKEPARIVHRRREPIPRDSLRKREELLKGKEGSRRRQRWENDRLLHNPWAQLPSAHDWQVHPTYPRHDTMPYYLAPLWDAHYAAKEQARVSRRKAHARADPHKHGDAGAGAADSGADQIPKELRLRLKHARAARGMLRDLEDDIRKFLQSFKEKQMALAAGAQTASSRTDAEKNEAVDTETDEDDEVVFVGRKHVAKQSASSGPGPALAECAGSDCEKLVFESSVDDQAAGFGRWLVHSLASYYGLRTWSVTVGDPPRREAYVGIDPAVLQRQQGYLSVRMATGRPVDAQNMLPRPLYVSV